MKCWISSVWLEHRVQFLKAIMLSFIMGKYYIAYESMAVPTKASCSGCRIQAHVRRLLLDIFCHFPWLNSFRQFASSTKEMACDEYFWSSTFFYMFVFKGVFVWNFVWHAIIWEQSSFCGNVIFNTSISIYICEIFWNVCMIQYIVERSIT